MPTTDDAQLPRLPTAIRTRRLTLRRVRLSDVDDVLDFATEDVWSRLLRPEASGPFQRRDAERWVASRRLADWRTEPTWAIEFDGRMSGMVGLDIEVEHSRAELCYALTRELRGQGLTTEAAGAVVDRVFLDTQLGRDLGARRHAQPCLDSGCREAGIAPRGGHAPLSGSSRRTYRPCGLRPPAA